MVKNCFLLIRRGNKLISSFASFVGTLYGPKYDGKYLRSLTNSLLGDLTLKETLTNVLIPAFDVKLLQPVLFSTQDVNEINYPFSHNLHVFGFPNLELKRAN